MPRAVARIDAGAIARNCERLRAGLTGDAAFGAVVKADGYGHGAVTAARAAVAAGPRGCSSPPPWRRPGSRASLPAPS